MNQTSANQSSLSGEAATILIVDDSALVRSIIKEALDKRGFKSIEAGSGEEALGVLAKQPVSLITMDIDMSGIDGFEICRKVRKQEDSQASAQQPVRRVPVIFVTSRDGVKMRAKGFEVGACDYIVKSPQLPIDLISAVDRCLRPERIFDGLRVLVVDDSTVIRNMVQRWVAALGAEVVLAGDGQEGFERLQNSPSEYDVLILDYNMPNMSGLEVCRLARRVLGLKIPIFIVTGSEERELQLTFFQAGATDYLVKPFLQEELAARLRVHLQNAKRSRQIERLTAELQRSGELLRQFLGMAGQEIYPALESVKATALQIGQTYQAALGKEGQALLAAVKSQLEKIEQNMRLFSQKTSSKKEV